MTAPETGRASELVELGSSGVMVTRLGLGTAPIGGLYSAVGDETGQAVVRRAWELGLRHVDTAPLYGYGRAERRIGAVLKDKPRAEYVIATKVGRLLVDGGEDAQPQWAETDGVTPVFDFSYRATHLSIEESVGRLGVNAVDVVHVHDPDDHCGAAVSGAYRALAELRASGQVRAIGAGMNQAEMLARLVRRVDLDCVLLAGRYTLLDQSGLMDLLPLCHRRGVGVIVGGVYNSGLLADPRPGQHYDYRPADVAMVRKARRIGEICARHGVPLMAAAAQFPFGHPAVTCAVIGARTPDEVEENTALFEHPVPARLWQDLKDDGLLRADVPTPVNTP